MKKHRSELYIVCKTPVTRLRRSYFFSVLLGLTGAIEIDFYFISESVDPRQAHGYCVEEGAAWALTTTWRLEQHETLLYNISFLYVANGTAHELASVDTDTRQFSVTAGYSNLCFDHVYTTQESSQENNFTVFLQNHDADDEARDFQVKYHYNSSVISFDQPLDGQVTTAVTNRRSGEHLDGDISRTAVSTPSATHLVAVSNLTIPQTVGEHSSAFCCEN